ncbi:MAG: ribonuclease III [Oscillibacter sp.]
MQALEEKLQYHFKNPALLEEALRHSSYANEHRGANFFSNERLEFLGDSVLGFVTAEYLFAKHPTAPEGADAHPRAARVRGQPARGRAALELGKYLKLGNGEESCGGRTRPSILADATEAVFAAVYLDGGISAASALIHRVLLDTEREEVAEEKRRDYKTILQEFVQRTPNQTLSYRLFGESGPDHDKTFYFEVLLNGGAVGRARAAARRKPSRWPQRRARKTDGSALKR